MRWWPIVVALSACGRIAFDPASDGQRGSDGSLGDGALADTHDAALQGLPLCDSASSDLVACYRFESSSADESSYGNNGVATNVTYESAGLTGMSLHIGNTSAFAVPESASLDVTTAITLEAWVRPEAIPSGANRSMIIDNNGQYSLVIQAGGDLRCTNALVAMVPQAVTIGVWAHVACTYDGTRIILYVNGVPRAQSAGGGMISTIGTTGLHLGTNNPTGAGVDVLLGFIDQVAIWRVARTSQQICASAGTC